MRLFYYQSPNGNFGDDINPYLWPKLFPCSLNECFDDNTLFIGIGTLLNDKVPASPENKIIFSSGFGYFALPRMNDHWRFVCVRGPLTARILNLPRSAAISDGAMLLRELHEPADKAQYGVAFMPHHDTAACDDWRSICDSLSIHYIDPADPVEVTVDSIRSCSLLITEAMHGAIVADTFRIPWIPVRTRPHILEFKWQDWSASVGIQHQFEWLPRVWRADIESRLKRAFHPFGARIARQRLRWLARYGKRRLSKDAVFNDVYDRLTEAFYMLAEEVR